MSSLQNCKVQGWPLLILLKKKILLLSDGDRKKIIVTHTDHKTTGTADIIATVNTATPSKSYKNKIRLNLANVTLVVLVVCILYWRMREYTFSLSLQISKRDCNWKFGRWKANIWCIEKYQVAAQMVAWPLVCSM